MNKEIGLQDRQDVGNGLFMLATVESPGRLDLYKDQA